MATVGVKGLNIHNATRNIDQAISSVHPLSNN